MTRFRLAASALVALHAATLACAPSVPSGVRVLSLNIVLGASTLTVGQTSTASVEMRDESGNLVSAGDVAWSSSNPAVASVSAAQIVALAVGTTQIAARSQGASGSTTLTVIAVPAIPVSMVSVGLAASTVTAGQSTQATAVARDANGAALDGRAIAWSSSNAAVATVSASGLVTSIGAGNAAITATSEGRSGSAPLAVVAPTPAPVATVTVSLSAASVSVGQSMQATATTRDASGSVVTGRSIVWSSDNAAVATITSAGLVTAVSVGTARLAATSEGQAGSATVTVTAASTSAAECSAARTAWIWCDDFEVDRRASYYEYVTDNGAFVRAAGVGRDASQGMRVHFNAGQTSAGSLKIAFGRTPSTYFRAVDAGTANYREIYWRMYLRNQPGWTGGGGDKLSRATVFANSAWAQAMIAHLWSGDGAASNQLAMEPARGTDVQGNLLTTTYNDFPNLTWLGNAPSPLPVFNAANVGTWHCIEAHVRLNDAGSSNGVFEFWINGASQVQKTTLNWLGAYSAYGINAVFLESYWNNGSPVAQERYFDNFVVSTERIGC